MLDALGIFFAKYLPYLLVLGFIISLFFKKGLERRIMMILEALLAIVLGYGLISNAFRFLYEHPRPFVALNFTPLTPADISNSFPSSHATFFFALAPLIFSLNRRLGTWYGVLVALNGIARVFVGVHWPFDALGGAAIGLGAGYVVHRFLKPYWMALASPERTV